MELVCGKKLQANTFCTTTIINWDDLVCPICLDSPHNGVLLQCSSYQNGCRAFLCNTDHLHSNCLDRFITACTTDSLPPAPPAPDETLSKVLEESCKPACPLCRGEVTGWVVVEEARLLLDEKKRSCEEPRCRFTGTYTELQEHAKSEHPGSRPSKIDPARKLDWENFQQSSEIIDVLSTIHSEVPRGVVLGDYVIEYGDDGDGTGDDEFEEGPGNEGGNWWTSCILYKMFDNIRNARRNRRRARMMSEGRRGSRGSSYDNSNSDDSSSVASIEFPVYRVDEIDDEFVTANGLNRSNAMHQRFSLVYNSRRRRSRFYAN
ncbi:Uncharacterized protein HA466_0127190 [Hirschfeldia incana]|nr:Uncharacterized protein HA466_0127190 [Hirschfeldia incana]